MKKRVLVACEYSGTVRDAFADLGWDAWSCDILPSDSPWSSKHLQGDVIEHLDDGWDLLVGHPPCTFLALSAARWQIDHFVNRKNKPPRWHDGSRHRAGLKEAVQFFKALWSAPVKHICLENPMSRASTLVAPKSQVIHPWQFGHGECKTTWLWLKNLPHLKPTKVVAGRKTLIHSMPPSEDRGKLRSKTYSGIAKAMAEQWTAHICDEDIW